MKMGAYGSPELQHPESANRWHVCQYCGNGYCGNYCPECGTKAGEKKPKRITNKWAIGVLCEGFILGFLAFFLIVAWTAISHK